MAGASERRVGLSWGHGKMIGGEDYLLQVAVPDALFHVSMAYAILRHNGVDIGKGDFASNQLDRRLSGYCAAHRPQRRTTRNGINPSTTLTSANTNSAL